MTDSQKARSLCLSRRSFIKVSVLAGMAATPIIVNPRTAYADDDIRQDATEEIFADSSGRIVSVPSEIESVIPSGPFAQAVLTTLCPEKIKAVNTEVTNDMTKYSNSEIADLTTVPTCGRLYSAGENTLEIQTIASLKPDIVVDIGDKKPNIVEDLEEIQERGDVSTVFIESKLGDLPATYRFLGNLLGCVERAEYIASHVESVYERIASCVKHVAEKKSVLFAEGTDGFSVRGPNSPQAKAIEYVGGVSAAVYSGERNSIDVDINTVAAWNPDWVIFTDETCYHRVFFCTAPSELDWLLLPAIQTDNYRLIPNSYYIWFGRQPLFTQTIGLLWLGNLLYPDIYDIDIREEAQKNYEVFMGQRLPEEEIDNLLAVLTDNAVTSSIQR